jgi:alcohol dehydrogenase class IV
MAALTGMDTLTHGIEAYVSTWASPYTDLFSIESIRLCGEYLPQFVGNPKNLTAAGFMQLACVYGANAFTYARAGAVHAMAHPLGGHFGLHHGLACAVLLPYVMEFNLIACPHKYARVARALGENTEGLSLLKAAALAPQAVRNLLSRFDIPARLGDLGVTRDCIPAMAQDAIASGIHASNPRHVDLDTLIRLYEEAM